MILKGVPLKTRDETPEDKAKREAAEAQRQAEYEESVRLAVPRHIEALRKEIAEKTTEADNLEAMFKEFPNLRRKVGRWNKVAYTTREVNTKVTKYNQRFNCGCCNDSPLEIWPYLETPVGNVYSEPAMFIVGEKGSGGATPYGDWDADMRKEGIPEVIIEEIQAYFNECAKNALTEEEE